MPEQDLFTSSGQQPKNRVQNKPRKGRRGVQIVGMVMIVIVFAAIVLVYLNYGNLELRPEDLPAVRAPSIAQAQVVQDTSVREEILSASEPELVDPEVEALLPGIPRDEWYLRLVNHGNPLPDGFTVDVEPIDLEGRYFDARAVEPLKQMMADCEVTGLQPMIVSGSRSWEYQQGLFEARIASLQGEGMTEEDATQQALRENMAPGENEHNLSLAVDIVAVYNQRMQTDYMETPEYLWLVEHAPEYGFIQRYPLDKADITGVTFEPWHFRYVGVEQARLITDSGLCLEEYLA